MELSPKEKAEEIIKSHLDLIAYPAMSEMGVDLSARVAKEHARKSVLLVLQQGGALKEEELRYWLNVLEQIHITPRESKLVQAGMTDEEFKQKKEMLYMLAELNDRAGFDADLEDLLEKLQQNNDKDLLKFTHAVSTEAIKNITKYTNPDQ